MGAAAASLLPLLQIPEDGGHLDRGPCLPKLLTGGVTMQAGFFEEAHTGPCVCHD